MICELMIGELIGGLVNELVNWGNRQTDRQTDRQTGHWIGKGGRERKEVPVEIWFSLSALVV